jgi:phosphonate transport system permease protein
VAPSPDRLARGAPNMAALAGRMTPQDLAPAFPGRIALRIVETFEAALAGAVIGIALSLPVGWLAARGVSPPGPASWLARATASFLRTAPALVWPLLVVASVGLGAVAGTMTIVVDAIRFCGRFFAEAMEDSDREPQEALGAIGAGRLSILFGAILPGAAASLVDASLSAPQKAVRSSAAPGPHGRGAHRAGAEGGL